ncbi:Protein virilizer like protein [Argiope bruennichi]|uniref:Protein virilizer like protein n=1 Tax=Argiope bruennichi TaxID=94029 RepID=A0A8T0F0U6_ARGBR|nr:Protein virilizer like protein [Argiope bruennichi]
MGDDCELLFFDTFSHDTCEELNLDLVQFPRPVYIFEIRIIPLGARVQADFPGGHRLGATNPSSFQLEFFVNDLSKRSASTFERLGSLDYKQNVDIQFPVTNKVPTDGLVLRGWYSAVTLAVYGVITKVSNKERSSPPPPPPPQANARPQGQEHSSTAKEFESPVGDPAISEWDRNSRIADVPPEPPPPPVRASVVEASRFVEVPPLIHPQPEQHVQYTSEIPNVISGFSEPPPSMVYQECVPVPVPQVTPTSAPYTQYDTHYAKPWVPSEEQYQGPNESYDHQLYNRQPDGNIYQAPPDTTRSLWDPKDHLGTSEVQTHERENYVRAPLLEIPTIHRDKDIVSKDRNRDRPWDRDLHDYKDDDVRSRDSDSKRKDRGRRSRETSWERSSVDSDRYRDRERDRMRDSGTRDRDRDRNRDRGSFIDRTTRKDSRESKRPTTPPSPRKVRPRTPQTPPDERIGSGPRTPKDEPLEIFDDRGGDDNLHHTNFFEPVHRERSISEHFHNLSEGEIQDGENTEDDGYEEIVSEEEDMSDVEDRTIDIGEIDYDLGDETWNFMSSFSPYNCEFVTLQNFTDPTLFPFEITKCKNKKEEKIYEEMQIESDKLLEILQYPENQEHDERWVEVLESINENTLMSLLTLEDPEKFKAKINCLIDWVIEGLDFDLALKQPQTVYKVRHMKAGIRLATLLFETNEEIIGKLLEKDVPKLLIQLFEQPHMVLPVKLLIIRGIDSIIATQAGINYIVQKTLQFSPKCFDDKGVDVEEHNNTGRIMKTCYQKLLEFLVSKQLTRVVCALSSLLSKIHLYEVLLELSDSVEKLVQSTQVPDIKSAPSDSSDTVEARATSLEPELETVEPISNSSETAVQVIISSLQEITCMYHNAWKNLAQMKRFLPARSQFEFPKSPYNPYQGLLRMFKQNKLLENIFVLLSSPALSGHPGILSAVKELLSELLSSQEGMLFLLSLTDVINGIQRTLLHTVDETREENADENVAQNLGMQIVYHLQALLYVDCLMAYHAKGGIKKELDDPDIVSALHHMYTMIFSSIGRQAVINVLTSAENFSSLLPFVQMSGTEDFDVKQSKSVCAGYATELIMLVVNYSENVPMLEKFSDALYNLSQQEITPKLHDLGFWMAPTRSLSAYNYEAILPLITLLKNHTEDASSLPPELITTLRILQYLTLPQEDTSEKDEKELKYMYAIIQVFSNNGMDSLKNILVSISDIFLKPSHQSPSLIGLQGVLVVSIVKPSVFILKAILANLISSRGTEFKDLTAVPILLNVYSLMLLIPPSSYSYQLAQAVQAEIIEALLTFTQPFLGSAESEEALNKSLWTEMVQEILKFTKLSPSNFVTGLTVFSELLPLPLPLQTRELSSSLPCKEHMVVICGALIQHIGCHKHSYSSVLPSLRSLVMLTEHDYGYFHVKQGLVQHPGAIYSLFTRFSSSFSKDSSDCLSTLSTTLEFLRLMVNGYEDGAQTGRTLLLSTTELADLLREDPSAKDKDEKTSEPFQPVVELEKLLTEFGNDEEAVESLLESISSLLTLLNSASDKETKNDKEMVEPVLPQPESQSAQFASRAVYIVGDVEEGRLSPAYWLALPGADDADQEQEQVAVDLVALAEKTIAGEFSLRSSLESLCLSTETDGDIKSKKKGISTIGAKRKYSPLINPSLIDVNNKRPFIAPMRGRGFSRATSHSSRANDPFRSRPPNTSRPPSMHVDDFVALESHHSGNNSQVQTKRPQKEGSRGRGRGFERNQAFTSTRGTGGRFFSPPGPYGRRESNRGGNRGAGRISNNTWNNRSNQNSGQKLSPGAGQRNSFGSHRNDYNASFNQQDMRTTGQSRRDPYSDMNRNSNVASLNRFSRGLRTGGMNQQSQGHWQDNRNKSQNQRFITPGTPSRGGGRRDMNARHNRNFTR